MRFTLPQLVLTFAFGLGIGFVAHAAAGEWLDRLIVQWGGTVMKESVDYLGWTINTSRQRHHQFPDWLATCWQGNVMRFNVEGNTRIEALEKAKAKIGGQSK